MLFTPQLGNQATDRFHFFTATQLMRDVPGFRSAGHIFEPKLATALTRTSIVHTALDSLGHRLSQGTASFPGLLFLLSSLILPILSQSESRLNTQTLTHLEFACWPVCGLREAD